MVPMLLIEKKNGWKKAVRTAGGGTSNAPPSKEERMRGGVPDRQGCFEEALLRRFVNTANIRLSKKRVLRFSGLFHKIKSLPPMGRQFVFSGPSVGFNDGRC